MIRSKRDLELELSILKRFENPNVQLEQYATPDNIAAEWVWNMAMKGEVQGKFFLDAACGTGILGLALLLMGAKRVIFLDQDQAAIDLAVENYYKVKQNYLIGKADFVCSQMESFNEKVDVVVQNPPFGTKDEHADKRFLEKAFTLAPVIYSMHKTSTQQFIETFSRAHGFTIRELWQFDFPVKSTFKFHQKPVVYVDVTLFRMVKN